MAVYRAVVTQSSYNDTEEDVIRFRETLGRDVPRSVFCYVAARDNAQALLGFGRGYVNEPGFWWHNTFRSRLDPDTAKFWLVDRFEVAELAVIHRAPGKDISGQSDFRAVWVREIDSKVEIACR